MLHPLQADWIHDEPASSTMKGFLLACSVTIITLIHLDLKILLLPLTLCVATNYVWLLYRLWCGDDVTELNHIDTTIVITTYFPVAGVVFIQSPLSDLFLVALAVLCCTPSFVVWGSISNVVERYGQITRIGPTLTAPNKPLLQPIDQVDDQFNELIEAPQEKEYILCLPHNSSLLINSYENKEEAIKKLFEVADADKVTESTKENNNCTLCDGPHTIPDGPYENGYYNYSDWKQYSYITFSLTTVTDCNSACVHCKKSVVADLMDSGNSAVTTEDILVAKI